jgi:hypothetical protein
MSPGPSPAGAVFTPVTNSGAITVNETNVLPTVQALSYGAGTHTVDVSLGSIVRITLTASTGALTFGSPSGGQILYVSVIQSGAGSFTVTWPTNVRWIANTAPTLTTTTGHLDCFTFIYNGTNWQESAGRAMNVTLA